jgi:hypothetical protein
MSDEPAKTNGAYSSALDDILDGNTTVLENQAFDIEVNEEEQVDSEAPEGFCVECEGVHSLLFHLMYNYFYHARRSAC